MLVGALFCIIESQIVDWRSDIKFFIAMGLLRIFKRPVSAEEGIKELGFEASECSQECDGCTAKYPSSLSFQDDDKGSLYGSTKPFGMNIIVPTNRNDWAHDAVGVSHTLAHAVDKWTSGVEFPGLGESTRIKVNVSSLSTPSFSTNPEYVEGKRGDLLLFPFFVWVRNVTIENCGSVLDKVVPDVIRYRDEGLAEFPETTYPEFPDVTVMPDLSASYVFLCSHKTRDKRCGITAPIMKKEMDIHLRELGLIRDFSDTRPGGVHVAYVNHIGGHKYAANVIIYLRKSGKNIWLARCQPPNAVPIIDECIVNDGKVWPEKVRQVQKYKPIDW